MRIGYARVSTDEQDRALQLDALLRAGCEKTFEETGSGKNIADRPIIQDVMRYLRKGDELVVWRLDRLSRSLRELLDMIETINAAGAHLVSLKEHLDTTTATGRLMFQVAGAFSEFERSLIQERTREGLLAARARGRKGGRLPLPDAVCRAIAAHYSDRTLEVGEFCRKHRISRTTFYKYAARFKELEDQKKASAPAKDLPRAKKPAPAKAPAKARLATRRAAG